MVVFRQRKVSVLAPVSGHFLLLGKISVGRSALYEQQEPLEKVFVEQNSERPPCPRRRKLLWIACSKIHVHSWNAKHATCILGSR